jgi:hypothetical protein
VRIDPADPSGTAATIAAVLRDPQARKLMQTRCDALRGKYLWPTVVGPLVEAIGSGGAGEGKAGNAAADPAVARCG